MHIFEFSGSPLSVKIEPLDGNLQENMIAKFRCVVAGSNPPPEISWYLQGNQVTEGVIVSILFSLNAFWLSNRVKIKKLILLAFNWLKK